jgi:hypothetical protein
LYVPAATGCSSKLAEYAKGANPNIKQLQIRTAFLLPLFFIEHLLFLIDAKQKTFIRIHADRNLKLLPEAV